MRSVFMLKPCTQKHAFPPAIEYNSLVMFKWQQIQHFIKNILIFYKEMKLFFPCFCKEIRLIQGASHEMSCLNLSINCILCYIMTNSRNILNVIKFQTLEFELQIILYSNYTRQC